jgi:hypothetical protein
MGLMSFVPDQQFRSVAECLATLVSRFAADGRIEVELIDPVCGTVARHAVPPFLFRGERVPANGEPDFTSTIAGHFRPRAYALDNGERLGASEFAELEKLRLRLMQRLMQADYSLSREEAAGFLHHYGIPSLMIDFSLNLGVAASFTCSAPSQRGRICVLRTSKLPPQSVLADLSDHPWAERPFRQKAVGINFPPDCRDLKDPDARSELALEWYQFDISPQEWKECRSRYLINDALDPTSGILLHHTIEYVEAFGPLPPRLSRWLVERLPVMPRVALVKSHDGEEALLQHLKPNVVGAIDKAAEQEHAFRYLCGLDDSFARVRDFRVPLPGSIWIDPRTFHSVDCSRRP